MKTWPSTLVGIALVLIAACPTLAEIPPTPSRSLTDLVSLFPSTAQLPPGMVLVEEGSRSATELAETFPDPVDAAQVLNIWGWAFNAYHIYEASPDAGPDTPAHLEVSLHQFTSNTGASYALSYFAHGRAVMLEQAEGPTSQLRPCEAGVSGSSEVTRYLRYGDLLMRVTSVMPVSPSEQTYYLALGSATAVAFTVLQRAGGSIHELDQTCR